jgi:citrate lyase subunit beta/citryl-CoA lyase
MNAGPAVVDALRVARTLLFVPGHRPDRFTKAAAVGADAVVLDLEDAVAPGHKDTARSHVARYLDGAGAGQYLVVRINAAGTPWHDADVAMLRGRGAALMLPKADDPHLLARLVDRLGPGLPVVPLMETATGILHAAAVCAVPGVVRAAFGSLDLAAQLDIDPADHDALLPARGAVVLACAAARLPGPLDGVTTAVADDDAARADAAYGRRLGFTGKLCIHPRQVAVVAPVFTPTAAQRDWARAVLDAIRATDGSVAVLDGRMVDAPVVARAHRLLALSPNPCPAEGPTS